MSHSIKNQNKKTRSDTVKRKETKLDDLLKLLVGILTV